MTERPLLRELLGPYVTPGLELPGYFRFHDAPPLVVRSALEGVDASCATGRPNGQPPSTWLVDTAELFGGTLSGQVGTDPPSMRIDALCVAGDRGGDLARAVDRDWPVPVHGQSALDLAVAEGWSEWDADEPEWTGNGRELLDDSPRAAVVGLWWD